MKAHAEFNLVARARSFRYAARGLFAVLAFQHNAWIHAVATGLVLAAGLFFGLSALEWCVVALAIALVWAAEAFNTALEILCDVVSPEFHPLVEKVKDAAAGAVLICALAAAGVGLILFGSHVASWLSP